MALTIENGTGVAGADSFNTVEQCSAHAVAYFGASLSGNAADKEAALRRAWVFMSALDWLPGLWPTFGGTIPAPVKLAQSVFARAEFKAAGFLSPEIAMTGRKVLTEVDGVKWSVIGDAATVEQSRPVVTMAFDLLRPWLAVDLARDRPVGLGLRALGA